MMRNARALRPQHITTCQIKSSNLPLCDFPESEGVALPTGEILQGSFLPLDYTLKQRALALGLGGAGNDLLTHVMDSRLDGVYCIAADTDRYHLQTVRAHSKFLLEDAACSDAGTRGDIGLGKKAALKVAQTMKGVFDDADLVFVLAGMGGGTGSGAAPVLSEVARKQGAVVVGLVTRPFPFERNRLPVAIDSVRMLLNACDTVVLLDSQSPEPSSLLLPFGMTPDAAGQTCCSVIKSIVQTFSDSSLVNGDLDEFRTMLRRGGLAKAGTGESYSLSGAEEATLNALRNAMPEGDFVNANGVFLDIVDDGNVQEADVACALESVSRRISSDSEFLYGRRADPMQRITRANMLFTGVSFPYAWSWYRRMPVGIYELEPESGEDESVGLDLDLHQIEDFAV